MTQHTRSGQVDRLPSALDGRGRAVVIGAGLGGLASAMRLGAKGWQVTVVDRLDRPGVFWRRTDQTFLEDFFPDWHGLPVFYNMLQYVWFNMPALWSWDEIHILHFQYEKPWQDHAKASQLRPLIDLWRGFAGQGPRLDPASLPSPA